MMKEIVTALRYPAGLLLAVMFSGCVLLRPTDPYTTLIPQLVRNGQKVPLSITTYDSDGLLTVERAIEIALANNPKIGAARYKVDTSKAESDIAFGGILPNLDLVGSYAYFRDDRLIKPRRPGTAEVLQFTDQLVCEDVVLRMPLFSGGRLISEIRAAKLLQTASEHRLARSRKELVFNVSSVFYSILSQDHVIESLEFSRRTLKEHLKRVGELIQAQKAAKVDQLRTDVRLADLEQRLARERNVLAIQYRILTNLMGVQEKETAPVSVSGELVIDETFVPDVDESFAKTLERRSDYLAARAELEAQAKRVDASRARHSPTVVLEGSYGIRADATSSNVDNNVASVGIGINIPIYAGGRISANVRKERAILATGQETLRELELQINLEVETAILNMRSSRERVRVTEKSIEQAQESLRIEREKYNYAKGSITDVLDAQSALLDSQMNYYRALADYSTAFAQYRLAIGEK